MAKSNLATKSVLVLNGPNLNMLGTREPGVYGRITLAEIGKQCEATAHELGLGIDFRQSNSEGVLIDWVQQALGQHHAIVINPGGYSHTSVALMDALLTVALPTFEVHISNIHRREEFRHFSYISRAAVGVICGMGAIGYSLALRAAAAHLQTIHSSAP